MAFAASFLSFGLAAKALSFPASLDLQEPNDFYKALQCDSDASLFSTSDVSLIALKAMPCPSQRQDAAFHRSSVNFNVSTQ